MLTLAQVDLLLPLSHELRRSSAVQELLATQVNLSSASLKPS